MTYTLLANPGTGSAIVEAALELAGLPYAIEPVDPWTAGASRERLRALNPLLQVPTLLLPDGGVITESAAMVLHVADRAPAAGLAPAADDAARPAFLRWLTFLVASLYPTFTFATIRRAGSAMPPRATSFGALPTSIARRCGSSWKRRWTPRPGASARPCRRSISMSGS